jgi:hypothetical protein
MPSETKPDSRTITSFLIELVIYAVLVTIYFLLALHFLGGEIKRLYDYDKRYYAATALALIVGQGVGLEMLTTWLLGFIRRTAK